MILGTSRVDQLNLKDLKTAQELNPVLVSVKHTIETGKTPAHNKNYPPDVTVLIGECCKLELKVGFLFRVRKTLSGR